MATLGLVELSVLGGLVALLFAVLLWQWHRQRKLQQTLEQLAARLESVENDQNALLDANLGMGKQMQEMLADLKDTREKQQQLEQRDLGALPYNEAMRLVAAGADADQLVTQCGLSRSEADLVLLLHQKSPPVVAPMADYEQSVAAPGEEPIPAESISDVASALGAQASDALDEAVDPSASVDTQEQVQKETHEKNEAPAETGASSIERMADKPTDRG